MVVSCTSCKWKILYLQEKLSLGALPQSRFMLAHLGLMVSEHHGHSLSLLLNSGVLALTQTILRLVGKISVYALEVI